MYQVVSKLSASWEAKSTVEACAVAVRASEEVWQLHLHGQQGIEKWTKALGGVEEATAYADALVQSSWRISETVTELQHALARYDR